MDSEPWYEALRWPVEVADLKPVQTEALRVHVVEHPSNALGDLRSGNNKHEPTAAQALGERRLDLADP